MNQTKSRLFGAFLLTVCLTALTVRPSTANNPTQFSPESLALIQQWDKDRHDAQVALKAKGYATAEADFKKVSSFGLDGESYFGLAQIYTAQGRTAKALQAFRTIFHPPAGIGMGGTFLTRAHLEYALLLNQIGRWPEAVASYQAAIPGLSRGGMPKVDAQFDPTVRQPAALEAALHLALGLDASFHCGALDEYQGDRAFSEYEKAMQLAPDWATANYYYGYGWQHLDLKGGARRANVEQAKAAFQQAAAYGEGEVKKAAEEALMRFK